METRQTALQWLITQIEGNIMWTKEAKENLGKALQMDQWQIEDAYESGHLMGVNDLEITGTQYYRENYNEATYN
jgi:hypothetical protein